MRLVTFDRGGGPEPGVVRGEMVHAILGEWRGLGLAGLLRVDPELESLDRHADDAGSPLDDIRLLPPVTHPRKIVCIGLNYLSHAREQGAEPPDTPTFFGKFTNALAAPGAEVALPSASDKVDYEAEVAFVIGRRCQGVDESRALDHVAGYTLFNDLSARDLQFRTPQWMPGKVFDGAAPCGPWLVTPDEAGPHDRIEIELAVNGEIRQSASTADLVHPVPALASHLSQLMTLEAGDVVATGTPAGVGSLRRPRVWLRSGDEVVISSPTLGRLATTIRSPRGRRGGS